MADTSREAVEAVAAGLRDFAKSDRNAECRAADHFATEAADTLAALLAERDALKAERDHWQATHAAERLAALLAERARDAAIARAEAAEMTRRATRLAADAAERERDSIGSSLRDEVTARLNAEADAAAARAQVRAALARAEAAEAEVAQLVRAGDALSVAAQTTGGVAGRDEGLMEAVEAWTTVRAALGEPQP